MTFSRPLLFISAILFSICVFSLASSSTEEETLFHQLLLQMEHPGVEAYNLADLRRNAAYSSIARCLAQNPKSVINWNCKWCRSQEVPPLTFVSGGLSEPSKVGWFAGYDATRDHIVLVFKSSGGLENWILNLASEWTDFPVSGCGEGCKIHKGFLFAYQEVRPAILSALKDLSAKFGRNVSITGHSLGGALATIAAFDLGTGSFSSTNVGGIEVWHNQMLSTFNELSDEEYLRLHNTALSLSSSPSKPIKAPQFNSIHDIKGDVFTLLPIYQFGAPRVVNTVGSEFFTQTLKTPFFRVTHRADPVPHLPLISWHANHVGREIFFPNKDASLDHRLCSSSTSEDASCSNSQIAILVLDHKWYGGYNMVQDDDDCEEHPSI